ncbi:Fe-S cluster assembly protein SufB [Candidatus Woesearchaeota archaeon]|nr:Fe-S cluster assembly protein SufB [Candidatus Woesearchaeota archaeon]
MVDMKGLSRKIVREISDSKNEPLWMKDFRLRSLDVFMKTGFPRWGPDLSGIDFSRLSYYLSPGSGKSSSWDDVPAHIRKTFDKLGVPEAERRFLGGLGAQYESEMVYHSLKKEIEEKGVIFIDTDSALRDHSRLFRRFFSKIVPPSDNKFAALNSALWSGGSFVYVPEGVKVNVPLQAYFRINAQGIGQFERTLIVVGENASLNYIEGCTAPVYSSPSLHAGVVEVIALKGSTVRYTTIQNWSRNVYNLVTKRAHAYAGSVVEWVDGNLGSKVTMKYPSIYLKGKGSRADILSVSFSGKGQVQDLGGKVLHLAPGTSSRIISKSICQKGGSSCYRGLVYVRKGMAGSRSSMRCDSLLLDSVSKADAFPSLKVEEKDVELMHEATVGRVSEDALFYLMSRGLSQSEAVSLVVLGFISQFTRELPMEYAVELNRLIRLNIEGF